MTNIEWFKDCIPLDPLIAPMVLFFNKNGITTTQSCQGGKGHLYGCPTINFRARTLKEIDRVCNLLRDNDLDTSLEIGLMTGYFTRHDDGSEGRNPHWGGQAKWIWNGEKKRIYNRVIKLVDMKEIACITDGTQDRNLMKKLGSEMVQKLFPNGVENV